MDGLTEGRIVHYVLNDGRSKGEHRPAIIVSVWDQRSGSVNMTVFTDYVNDYPQYENENPDDPKPEGRRGTIWATSVLYSEDKELGTWHWIEAA